MRFDAPQSLDGLRRAALTLHALGPQDQAWLMQQLPAQQAMALTPLLEELENLGIPKDRTLVQAALAAPSSSAVDAGVDHAEALCRTLMHEAPALQSQLLSLLSSAQRAAVLAAWPADALRPTPAAVPPSWTPALQAALRQAWLAQAQERGDLPGPIGLEASQ